MALHVVKYQICKFLFVLEISSIVIQCIEKDLLKNLQWSVFSAINL